MAAVTLNAGAKAEAFSSGLNLLYVPDMKVFGGNLGLSVTIPFGYVNYDAFITTATATAFREVNGCERLRQGAYTDLLTLPPRLLGQAASAAQQD